MAMALEGGCRVSRWNEGQPVRSGPLRVCAQIGRAVGAQAISLRVLEMAPGSSPAICNAQCDEVLYVVEGEGTVILDGSPHGVGPDTAFYVAPGVTLSIQNPGPDPLRLVSSRCPEPDQVTALPLPPGHPGPSHLRSDVEQPAPSDDEGSVQSDDESAVPSASQDPVPSDRKGLVPSAPHELEAVPRLRCATLGASGAVPLVRLPDRKSESTGDRWYRVLIDEGMGSTQVTQFVGAIPPGRAPDHFHL